MTDELCIAYANMNIEISINVIPDELIRHIYGFLKESEYCKFSFTKKKYYLEFAKNRNNIILNAINFFPNSFLSVECSEGIFLSIMEKYRLLVKSLFNRDKKKFLYSFIYVEKKNTGMIDLNYVMFSDNLIDKMYKIARTNNVFKSTEEQLHFLIRIHTIVKRVLQKRKKYNDDFICFCDNCQAYGYTKSIIFAESLVDPELN